MPSFRSFTLTCLPIALCLCGRVAFEAFLLKPRDACLAADSPNNQPATTDLGLTPAPMPNWFEFKSADVVNKWVDELDNKSITGHAWDLWAHLPA